jgi:hypothetical protein
MRGCQQERVGERKGYGGVKRIEVPFIQIYENITRHSKHYLKKVTVGEGNIMSGVLYTGMELSQ